MREERRGVVITLLSRLTSVFHQFGLLEVKRWCVFLKEAGRDVLFVVGVNYADGKRDEKRTLLLQGGRRGSEELLLQLTLNYEALFDLQTPPD